MHKTMRILTVSALLLLCGAGWLHAESTPEAVKWLEKLKTAYDQSYRVNYTAEMSAQQAGQTVGMNMKGVTTQADPSRMRMDLDVKMSMGGMQIDLAMLGVMDGETLWLETNNPMMGGKQIMKMPADKLDAMGNGGIGLAGGGGGIDPVGQIERMTEMFNFDVSDNANGKVTLRAEMSAEVAAELSKVMPESEGVKQFVLVLDEKTGFPVEMRMGGEPPFMVMTFGAVEILDPDAFDPGTFSYTPPEGAQVIDMTQ